MLGLFVGSRNRHPAHTNLTIKGGWIYWKVTGVISGIQEAPDAQE